MDSFKINHNFGFGNYEMIAEVKEFIPPNRLSISEFCKEDPEKGFPHSVVFEIFPDLQKCKLSYTISGTYGRMVQDMSFKPILKSVIKVVVDICYPHLNLDDYNIGLKNVII